MERIALKPRKALDLLSYVTPDGFNERGLVNDTAALVTEEGVNRDVTERVYQSLEAVIGESVINFPVNKQVDVLNFYEKDSPESVAGAKIKDFLLKGERNDMFAWISPKEGPYDYEEARIRVGIIVEKMGFKILKSYGIPVNYESEELLNIFYRLQEFSSDLPQTPKDPEDLRGDIVTFRSPNSNESWLEFLKNKDVLPQLTSVWEAIENGSIGEFNRKAKGESRQEFRKVLIQEPLIMYLDEEEAIRVGALIEKGMKGRGWHLEGKFCGVLNSDLASSQQGLFLTVGISDGKITLSLSDEFGPLQFTCPACGCTNTREPMRLLERCQNSNCPRPDAVKCG